jgi:spoIIIJ-associated protein
MTEQKFYIDITAANVEDAIDQGLEILGLTRAQVDVEILEHPRPKILGFGGRDALVRIKKQGYELPSAKVEKPVEKPVEPKPAQPATAAPPAAKQPSKNTPADEHRQPVKAEQPTPQKTAANDEVASDDEQVIQTAIQVVTELLEKMRMQAEVNAHFVEPEDEYDEKLLWVDVEGKDLSILIGRRSETLNALQYIASLIINKQLGRMVPFMIDVQGYRNRRTQQIRQLALRMAEQCVKSGRRQLLEPMSAHERRIVHLTLRDHKKVYTESVGEGESRKVTILPKKE